MVGSENQFMKLTFNPEDKEISKHWKHMGIEAYDTTGYR